MAESSPATLPNRCQAKPLGSRLLVKLTSVQLIPHHQAARMP
jgi:hypothetical protein